MENVTLSKMNDGRWSWRHHTEGSGTTYGTADTFDEAVKAAREWAVTPPYVPGQISAPVGSVRPPVKYAALASGHILSVNVTVDNGIGRTFAVTKNGEVYTLSNNEWYLTERLPIFNSLG